MGSTENMVGSIVWVRRRNGSWWPGKILGPNELSASHLMSPRSGTPVKLLGREDASVDWYNLEKSKRVKAFRCGEFDDCIERAESSLGLPSKKREKYARREDAILHALELEKQNLVKKHSKLALTNFTRENSSDSGRRGFATSSLALENGNEKSRNHDLYQLDEKVDVSTITVRNNTPLHEHKPQDRTYPHFQGQNNIDSHQMKGLQGFGLRAIHVNRTTHSSAGFDDLNRMEIGRLCGVPTNDPCFESSSDSDPWKEISKGKRSLEGFVETSLQQQADYSLQHDFDFLSMYGKREGEEGGCQFGYFSAEPPRVFDSLSVPQEQVEMPTSMLDMANCHHGTFAEETASGSSEETESDSSESTRAPEPHVEAGVMFSDVETQIKAQARKTDSSGMREGDESTINDESHEVSVHDLSQFYLPGPNSSGFGVPKWLLKRKRNVRNFPRKPTSRFSCRQYLEETGGSLNHDNGYTENDVDFMVGNFIQTGFLPSQAAAKGPNFAPQNIIDWEELAWGRPSTLVGLNARDLLIDVDLKVQANYQGENVPWVSLTSRLNGKAIIGHPIQIEAVEDSSTDILVSSSDLNYDTDGTLPSWRAGNFCHLSSRLDGGENAENRYFHQAGKGRYKNSSSTVNKTHTPLPNPIQRMKKKMNPSSFRFDHKSKKRRKEKNTNYLMDGAIKSVDASPSAVACVPVKLVFSRLLEAVGRAHSGPAKRVVSMNRRNHFLGTL